MQQGLLCSNAVCGVALQHLFDQVQARLVERHLIANGLRLVDLLFALREEGQLLYARPLLLGGRASDLENLLQLFLLVVASEKRLVVDDLRKNATNRPNIDRSAVVLAAHKYVGSAVPQRHDFVSKVLYRDSESSGQTEIRKLKDTLPVDQQVLGLQISVENLMLMALADTCKQLPHEDLDLEGFELVRRGINEFLQILVEVFEHQRQLLVSMEHVDQAHDVGVL